MSKIIATLAAFLIISGIVTPASATLINLDPDNFGHLGQLNPRLIADNVCSSDGLTACGPVAAVNSFAYLQKKFGENGYDNFLIPKGDLVATAEALAKPGFMNCGPCGTSIGDFSSGKKKWIENKVPDITNYSLSGLFPKIDTLLDDMKNEQDTELLLGFYNGEGMRVGGHFVTLFMLATGAEGRQLGFVDPFNTSQRCSVRGHEDECSAQDVTKSYTINPNFILVQNYGLADPAVCVGGCTTRIEFAVDESPVPEPGTLMLMLLVVPVFGWAVRSHRRRLQSQPRRGLCEAIGEGAVSIGGR